MSIGHNVELIDTTLAAINSWMEAKRIAYDVGSIGFSASNMETHEGRSTYWVRVYIHDKAITICGAGDGPTLEAAFEDALADYIGRL